MAVYFGNYAYIFNHMSILIIIKCVFFISFLCTLWFFTDFFVYYMMAFKRIVPNAIYNWFLVDEYFNRSEQDINKPYIPFLLESKYFSESFLTKFFLKLIRCNICFTTWLSLIGSIICGNIFYIGIIFFFSIFFTYWTKYFLKIP